MLEHVRVRCPRGLGMVGVALALVACLAASAASFALPEDEEVLTAVLKIFGGLPEEDHAHRVLFDDEENVYYAFHLSNWVGVSELRAYWIPADEAGGAAEATAAGNHAEAYEILMESFGDASKYLSDVALDGINDRQVPVGVGTMRDHYSPRQFASREDAQEAYLGWLRRAVALVEAGA